MIRVRTALLLLGLVMATGIGWHSYRSATADDLAARCCACELLRIDQAAGEASSYPYHQGGRLTTTLPGPASDDPAQSFAADLDDDDDSDSKSIAPTTPFHCVTAGPIGSFLHARLEPTRCDAQFLTACRLRC
jgi:hypothetical protein